MRQPGLVEYALVVLLVALIVYFVLATMGSALSNAWANR
jgi:Flp pilus assembly pilin Flp